jgi:hypothetical protein
MIPAPQFSFFRLALRTMGIVKGFWQGAIFRRGRMVAIELGMCRSSRSGGSSGSVTVGIGKLREQPGEPSS